MMLPKPAACLGCPMYGDGKGFVPDEIIPEAPVFILMQNPGKHEEEQGKPAVGATGQTMDKWFLPKAGLVRGSNVSVGNVLKCRWKHTNTLPPEAVLKPALAQCLREHLRIPAQVQLVVAQGALAWRAMEGPGSISNWRGYLAPGERQA